MRRVLIRILSLWVLALVPACIDDPTHPIEPDGPPAGQQTFLALTTRDAIVNNLELAWNQRRIDRIDALLDDAFVFRLSNYDVGMGLPEQWDRAQELAITDALFKSNTASAPIGPVCRWIRFDVSFDGDIPWEEAPVSAATNGEVWYTAKLFYSAVFEMEPDNTYIMIPGATLEFTVRPADDEWRLVELKDLAGNNVLRNDAGVGESTWGSIKGLYLR